jgi:hypothetical protein
MGLSLEQLRALRQLEVALHAQDPRLGYQFTAWERILADREQDDLRRGREARDVTRAQFLPCLCCTLVLVGWALFMVILAR